MNQVDPPPAQALPHARRHRGGWGRFIELSMRRTPPSGVPAQAASGPVPTQTHALSHHDVLMLLEPFVRCGRQLDMAASDRLHRRLVFKPLHHAGPAPGLPALVETLELHSPRPGRYRLLRLLVDGQGLCARLQAEGRQPQDLLSRIDGVPLARQWQVEAGFVAARSHRLEEACGIHLVLTGAEVRLDALTMKMDVPETPGVPARIELGEPGPAPRSLPEDLLAVLGWSWSALKRAPDGFIGCLRLQGGRRMRSLDAEHKLLDTARHLARTLAQPPADFHRRLWLARWGVTLRRAIPVGVVGSLATLAAAAEPLQLPLHSPSGLLLVGAPLLLLVLYYLRGAAPRIELPHLPRAGKSADW